MRLTEEIIAQPAFAPYRGRRISPDPNADLSEVRVRVRARVRVTVRVKVRVRARVRARVRVRAMVRVRVRARVTVAVAVRVSRPIVDAASPPARTRDLFETQPNPYGWCLAGVWM